MNPANFITDIEETVESPASYRCKFNHPDLGWIDCVATATDDDVHIAKAYDLICTGQCGEVKKRAEPCKEKAFEAERRKRLFATVLPEPEAVGLTEAQQAELVEYETKLHAVRFRYRGIRWPKAPSFLIIEE